MDWLLVFSHWILDSISWPLGAGARGLPLFFSSSPEVGLGLYTSTAGALASELVGLLLTGFMVIGIPGTQWRSSEIVPAVQ